MRQLPLIFRRHFILSLSFALIACFASGQQSNMPRPVKSGYAPINGGKLYYEVYGEGSPVVLLHGAYMTISLNWNKIIPELSKTRQVIALEMQGHGHTPLGTRPMSLDSLADDVAKLLAYLHVTNADLIGYSFGGSLAYKVAIDHPELLHKVIIISSTYKSDGWQKEVREAFSALRPEMFAVSPMRTAYNAVAPDTTQWTAFSKQMIALSNTPFNFGDEKIKAIRNPVMIISGDNDGLDKNVLMDTYKLLGGEVFADMRGVPKSRLAILPGQGHVSVMMQTDLILQFITGFLK